MCADESHEATPPFMIVLDTVESIFEHLLQWLQVTWPDVKLSQASRIGNLFVALHQPSELLKALSFLVVRVWVHGIRS